LNKTATFKTIIPIITRAISKSQEVEKFFKNPQKMGWGQSLIFPKVLKIIGESI